jgi:glycosyltransferase involved in cell wall biosynthesis
MAEDSKFLDIICFSDAPWEYPLWTNKQHVMSRIAKLGHRVLYVDPQFGFAGWLKWFIARRVSFARLFRWLKRESETLWIFAPILLPPRFTICRRVNDFLRLLGVRAFARWLGFERPILWIYHPDAVYFVGKLDGSMVVYDCVDEYSTFPAYAAPARNKEIRGNEERLLKLADIVFATSKPLFELKREFNSNTYFVQNVGDAEHFGKAMLKDTTVPSDIASVRKPIIGYVGTLDAYKVDFELIKYIATERSDWSIVLIGPVAEGDPATKVDSFKKFSNIHFLGERPYGELPGYIKAFGVCIIPYSVNEYTRYSFPLKVHEFLATGKPVVTTALPSVMELSDVLKIASNYEQFAQFLEEALGGDNPEAKAQRLKVARENTWEHRVHQLLAVVSAKHKG